MPSSRTVPKNIAGALKDAELMTDEEACTRNSITRSTLHKYRKLIEEGDPRGRQVSRILNGPSKRDIIQGALLEAVKFIQAASLSGNTSDPDMVTAITKAAKELNEILITDEVIQKGGL